MKHGENSSRQPKFSPHQNLEQDMDSKGEAAKIRQLRNNYLICHEPDNKVVKEKAFSAAQIFYLNVQHIM